MLDSTCWLRYIFWRQQQLKIFYTGKSHHSHWFRGIITLISIIWFCSENEVKILLDVMQMSMTKLLASPKFQLTDSVDELKLCRKGNFSSFLFLSEFALIWIKYFPSIRFIFKFSMNWWNWDTSNHCASTWNRWRTLGNIYQS